jgi:hypothetical protein
MTVGSLLGEGGITAYGFKNFGGEEFGSLADFYTYYEYEGIYYVDGTLFVWGVDVTILSIDGTEYTDGEYNENGYTEFEIASNPFDGATAEIKIQGTATETWDYEGVMTVGEQEIEPGIDFYGYFKGEYGGVNVDIGNLIPVFYAFDGNFNNGVYYSTEETTLNASIICEYLKINTVIYQNTSSEFFGKALDENPFPEAGETCTIKIKL